MIKDYQRFDLFDKLLIEKVILEPPFTAPGIMPNEACFLYAIRGKSRIFSSTSSDFLHTKEGIVMKCGNYFNEWLSTTDGEVCEAVAVHFYPEVIKQIYDKEFPDFIKMASNSKPASIQKVEANALMENYVKSLQFYFENPALVSDELLKLKVKELILLLAKTDNLKVVQDLICSFFTPTEFSFKEVIEANVYSSLTNDQLAALCNMSLSSFKREFEKVYQTSPAKYIKKRKLARAAQLLQNTNQRIGDIAFNCGFSEVAHFSKSFQKFYGSSPSDFRASGIA